MSSCVDCGNREGLCQRCRMEALEDRHGTAADNDREAWVLESTDAVWHATGSYDGHEHDCLCGTEIETPIEWSSEDLRYAPDRYADVPVCQGCVVALEGTRAETVPDDVEFETAGELVTDGGVDESYRMETDGTVVRYLYRVPDPDGYFYSTISEVQAKQELELLGITTRHTGEQFRSAESLEEFRENVHRLATDVYWFEDAVPTGQHIAELLYRAPWNDERYLYAATRSEPEFTSHEILGVVVRPPRETIDSTKWGRDEFGDNVDDVAESVIWLRKSNGRKIVTDGGLKEVYRRETIVETDDGFAIGEAAAEAIDDE